MNGYRPTVINQKDSKGFSWTLCIIGFLKLRFGILVVIASSVCKFLHSLLMEASVKARGVRMFVNVLYINWGRKVIEISDL